MAEDWSNAPFQPDWTSPPGATIKDILEERGISINDFSQQTGLGHNSIQALFKGERPITTFLANRLEEMFGASAAFWMEREKQYREDKKRLEKQDESD